MDKKKADSQKIGMEAIASLDRIVPKFSTAINFAVMNNRYVIIGVTYQDPNSKPVLIDRFMIDLDHARQLSTVLSDLIKKVDEINHGKSKSK